MIHDDNGDNFNIFEFSCKVNEKLLKLEIKFSEVSLSKLAQMIPGKPCEKSEKTFKTNFDFVSNLFVTEEISKTKLTDAERSN